LLEGDKTAGYGRVNRCYKATKTLSIPSLMLIPSAKLFSIARHSRARPLTLHAILSIAKRLAIVDV
jgi:hypothetical protein